MRKRLVLTFNENQKCRREDTYLGRCPKTGVPWEVGKSDGFSASALVSSGPEYRRKGTELSEWLENMRRGTRNEVGEFGGYVVRAKGI